MWLFFVQVANRLQSLQECGEFTNLDAKRMEARAEVQDQQREEQLKIERDEVKFVPVQTTLEVKKPSRRRRRASGWKGNWLACFLPSQGRRPG